MASTLDLASTKISKPEHINELGVSRETALILGQILSVKRDVDKMNRRTGKKFVELSRRLDTIEEHLGIGDDTGENGGKDEGEREMDKDGMDVEGGKT